MKLQKLIIPFILILPMVFASCIDRFYMNGSGTGFTPKLVIEGIITTDGEMQEIVISESAPTDKPEFSPLSGCNVRVEDDHGNSISFHESIAGHYRGIINRNFINVGSHYRLTLQIPDGKQYKSNYEELMPCPEIDSVYYELKSKPTKDSEVPENGLQFYIDYKGNQNSGHYYRWKLEETYEYHSTWPITRYMDQYGEHQLRRADYSFFTCYKTEELRDIFTLSTLRLTQNSYKRYALHFVNDHTQRLMHKYSVLVKQYSLTESAYNFWNNLRKNNKEADDLFEKQPAMVKGNIYNVNDSSEVVLGYFGVSSVSAKRIIVPGVSELAFNEVHYCTVTPPPEGPLPEERPLYWAQGIDQYGEPFWGYGDSECFICTLLGGTTQKPPYWDKQ